MPTDTLQSSFLPARIDPTAVEETLRVRVIYQGLELADIGIAPEAIGLDTLLFDEAGLGLDSVDALEVVAGLQRVFGITLPNVDKTFLDENCATLRRLTDLVVRHLQDVEAPPRAAAE